MNIIRTTLLSTTLLLFLTACSDTEDVEKTEPTKQVTKTQHISGKSTLSSAHICLDINANSACDEDDITTTADAAGNYTLTYSEAVEEGTLIIAEDGYNLILEQNNNRRFRFISQVNAALAPNNINTISSLITQLMQERGYTLTDAKQYLADTYNLEIDDILRDPIVLAQEERTALLLLVRGIEAGYANRNETTASKSARRAASSGSYVTPTLEASSEYLVDGNYLVYDLRTYISRIFLRIDRFYDEVRYFLVDTFSLCIWECPSGSYLSHSELAGTWFVHPQYNEEDFCVEIDLQDNYLEHHSEGQSLYSIFFAEISNTISIIDGWDIHDSFAVSSYGDSNNFDLAHGNRNYRYARMENLDACMDRKSIGSAIREGITKIKGKLIAQEDMTINFFTYLNADNNEIIVYPNEDGSFEYQARNAYEDPWIGETNAQMLLSVSTHINNQRVSIPLYIDRSALTLSEERHVADLGTLPLKAMHIQTCITNAKGEPLNGSFHTVVDYNSRATAKKIITDGLIDLYLPNDTNMHNLYVLDSRQPVDRNISQIPFASPESGINFTASCGQLAPEVEISTEVYFSQAFDSNLTTLRIYGLDRELVSSTRYDGNTEYLDVTLVKNGTYTVILNNNTNDKDAVQGKEINLSLNGHNYSSIIEHALSYDIVAFKFYYFEGKITALFDGYGRRLDGKQ